MAGAGMSILGSSEVLLEICGILIPLFMVSFIVLFIDFIQTIEVKKPKIISIILITVFICIIPTFYKTIMTIKSTSIYPGLFANLIDCYVFISMIQNQTQKRSFNLFTTHFIS